MDARVAIATGVPRARSVGMRASTMWLAVGCACLLGGCAIYHTKPLPNNANLARSPALTVPASHLGIPGLAPEPLDLAKGLDETNVITLAVLENPALRAARARAGVARAQLLEAGLLPDPTVSGGLSKSSLFTGYNVSLAEDVRALITRRAAKEAARAHLRQVNLAILWQEWQVAERARKLYIEARALAKLRGVLSRRRNLLARLYRRDQVSLGRHYLTVASLTADFAAWDSAAAAWRQFELTQNQNRHALDELLGLAPAVHLHLRGEPRARSVSAARYRRALAALPHRRPDLLALKAGYQSEQERLRMAILGQFPLVSAAVQKSRSAEEGIQSIGFNVTLTLPIFNRNRGPIAIGRASRAYLYRTYQAHLDETMSQADQVWKVTRIMRRQLASLQGRRARLERAAAAARRNLKRHVLTLREYAGVQSNALATRVEVIRLRASLEQSQAALAMLLAFPF